MTFEGLGEMFKGYSADTRAGKFPLVSMGGRAEGLACADPGARTPIGVSGNFYILIWILLLLLLLISLDTVVQNPSRGCRRVLIFCMGS